MSASWLEKLPERIRSKIAEPDANGCMLWLGAKQQGGYGMARHEGRVTTVHRIVYSIVVAPIADGLEGDHLCRNHACVNPAHIEPVTKAENQRRGMLGVLRTHCRNGHAYAEHARDTELTRTTKRRVCNTCNTAAQARFRARRASKVVAP